MYQVVARMAKEPDMELRLPHKLLILAAISTRPHFKIKTLTATKPELNLGLPPQPQKKAKPNPSTSYNPFGLITFPNKKIISEPPATVILQSSDKHLQTHYLSPKLTAGRVEA